MRAWIIKSKEDAIVRDEAHRLNQTAKINNHVYLFSVAQKKDIYIYIYRYIYIYHSDGKVARSVEVEKASQDLRRSHLSSDKIVHSQRREEKQ